MCSMKSPPWRRLVRRVVGGLILFGAFQAVLPARVQGQAVSAYSLATTGATIAYQPNPGAVPPARARAWPEQIHLNWNTSSGVPPSNTVRIALLLRYQGRSAVFPWDIPRQDDHYTIDLNGIASHLVATVGQMLPNSALPEAGIPLDGPVSVNVAPVLPGGGLGSYVSASNELVLTFQRVYGDLDAYVALAKRNLAASPPAPHHDAPAQAPSHCPRCARGTVRSSARSPRCGPVRQPPRSSSPVLSRHTLQ